MGIILILVLSVVAAIIIGVMYEEYEHQKYVEACEEKEKKRQNRLIKIPIENRKCGSCKFGKEIYFTNYEEEKYSLGYYRCSFIGEAKESDHIGCEHYDPILGSFYD